MALPLAAIAGIAGGASLLSGALGAYGNYKAGTAAARAQRRAAEANKAFANEQYAKQEGLEQPYLSTGTEALSSLNDLIKSGKLYENYDDYEGQLAFDPSSVDVTQDPGYAFRLQQGQKALDAGAGAKGQLFSGAQQKALLEYGQNLGSQEYNNAYNRQFSTFQDARNAQYNDYLTRLNNYNQNLRNQVSDLGNLSSIGERSVGRLSNDINAQTSAVMGQNTSIGNSNAALQSSPWLAMSGASQSVGNAIGDALNAYTLYSQQQAGK